MRQSLRPSGINHDIEPSELGPDVWNAGQNVVFVNGFAQSAPGWQDAVGACLFKPLWILPVITPTVFYWIYCGNTADDLAGGVGVTDGNTHWDITPVAGVLPTKAGDWTGGTLNGIPAFNGIGTPPMWWNLDTLAPAETLPGWIVGEYCQALRPFKYHLIAMNITAPAGDFGDLVKWSSAADPGSIPDSWTPEPANDAGNFTISATPGFIVDGGAMRDQFVVYKQHSTSILQYIAGQFVFSNRKAFVTSGILARNCWAEFYGKHYVLTDGDYIVHNGQQVDSLADGVNREFIFNGIDSNNYSAAFLAASHDTKQIWLCWPSQGNSLADTALVHDINTGVFGISDLPAVAFISRGILNDPGAVYDWDDLTGTWNDPQRAWNERTFNPTADILVMAQPEQLRLLGHGGFLRDGALVPVYLQLLGKDFKEYGAEHQVKTVTAIWSEISGGAAPEGLQSTYYVRVGLQKTALDPIRWQPRAPQNPHYPKHDMVASDFYISLELSGNQAAFWKLLDNAVEFEISGNA